MSSALFVGPDSQPDKYRLVRSVGRGGEATLYLAEVTLAGQTEPVVVKVLNADAVANEEQFAELSRRWNEQAELLRFINRLGVVGVREHFEGAPEHPEGGAPGAADRCLYLVMNHVDGVDLRDWRAEHTADGPRGQREILRHLEQVAEVLDLLHSGRATPSKRVVVHGDLSPGNVMISGEGQATLVDFGLSRIAARHITAKPWFTPGYAAPEIFTGEYTAATDRYAFGAIVYYALTGEEPPPASEQLRERFAALPIVAAATRERDRILAMFSAEPGDRPGAVEWIRALRSLSTSAPWSMPATGPGAAVAGGAAGAAAAGAAAAGAQGAVPPPPASAGDTGPTSPIPTTGPTLPSATSPTLPDIGAPAGGRPPGPGTAPPQGGAFQGPPPASGPHRGPSAAPRPAAGPAGPPPPPPASHRPVGGLRGAPSPQPDWSTPTASAAASGAPPTGPFPPPGAAGAASAPGPRKRRRGRLLAGMAVVAVVFLLLGAGGTYAALDRLGMLAGPGTGLQAGPVPEQEPSAAGGEQPVGEPEPSPSAASPTAPPAGQREDPDELHLASEQPVNDSIYTSTLATVNAEDYDEALTVEDYCSDVLAEYNLGRGYEEFSAVVGLSDESPADEEAEFTVIGDGEQLENKTLGLGEDAELEVDVTGVLRLQLVTGGGCPSGATAVWAEPVVAR
ncbi:protein kinase [Nocardiopsis sediminis]|uniref:non-specific serine/threonine protein kinase n=1 Tax=Nocardiopsis sediminis TaxID=1778267 RepID=A0ABV8FKA5_9ACTN